MGATKWRAANVSELIIEVWEALDCESVGAREIERIQQALLEKFGAGAVESPASIARTVADEGAVLRHPEVFDCDAEWRERKFADPGIARELSFASLAEAVESFVKLDHERQRLEGENDDEGLKRLRWLIVQIRAHTQMKAQSRIVDAAEREEAREIADWLRIWLQSPELFLDWLDLRQRSAEFIKKFVTKIIRYPVVALWLLIVVFRNSPPYLKSLHIFTFVGSPLQYHLLRDRIYGYAFVLRCGRNYFYLYRFKFDQPGA